MTKPTVPAIALLPVRLFFGATFLFAGLDKLLDPSFFNPSAPTSIQAQMTAFARYSPLGDVIRASLPLSGLIGLAIALAELGIGIGALTGLAFRVAAAGGALLSLLFFLSASWNTHPYYVGADLPYMIGWVTLAIAGHGDVWVSERVRTAFATVAAPVRRGATQPIARRPTAAGAAAPQGRSRRRRLAAREAARAGGSVALGYSPTAASSPSSAPPAGPRGFDHDQRQVVASPERRLLLQTGVLAGLAAIAASFALPLRAMGIFTEPDTSGTTPTPLPGSSPTAIGPSAAPGSSVDTTGTGAGKLVVAHLSDITAGGGAAAFTVPFDAPAPLPAGDPGIVVKLNDGSFVAYDTICTHAGCTVEWDGPDGVLLCPCHGAAFDPSQAAAVLQGPARRPLAKLPIVVDQAAGTVSLSG